MRDSHLMILEDTAHANSSDEDKSDSSSTETEEDSDSDLSTTQDGDERADTSSEDVSDDGTEDTRPERFQLAGASERSALPAAIPARHVVCSVPLLSPGTVTQIAKRCVQAQVDDSLAKETEPDGQGAPGILFLFNNALHGQQVRIRWVTRKERAHGMLARGGEALAEGAMRLGAGACTGDRMPRRLVRGPPVRVPYRRVPARTSAHA